MDAYDLEEMIGQLGFSRRCRWETNRSYCCPVLKDEDVDHILKCVRFAADMKKLRQGGLAITIYPQSNGTVHLNYDGWDYRGDDIYTTARKAVEALEGKR